MGFRFRRTKKILPGVRLNVGKRGVSMSFGPKGMKHTISTTGRTTTTVGIPGTGLSYSKSNVQGKPKAAAGANPPYPTALSRKLQAVKIVSGIIIAILIFASVMSVIL
ncbi:MAG: DUF4236 domain-containing protein [Clostridiales Family XIII bacterium]|jgi:hypothetical protein|nr:DUF4236 domain-containing protein [Clostridiales Family XIII bacterium]